jgi:hypothetical protein
LLLTFSTAIRFCRWGGISNRSAAIFMASCALAASTVPRCSARLRMISTRQLGIYNIAHKKRAIVTNTIEKMTAKIASPKMVRLIHTFPVRLSPVGYSFQFGRTSSLFPRPPHLAQTTRERNHGTSVSSEYFDTSISPRCRQASLRQDATSRRTPSLRMLPRAFIAGPGAAWASSDDLVGAHEDRWWYGQAERFCSFDIYRQF